jgi:N-acetyl-alpha-D-muramate 1-phosphate uridylyltransferase
MLPVAILAGGLATRLRPFTEAIPKSLLDIDGQPFLARQLRLLKENGVKRVVLCLGYLGEQIQQYVEEHQFGLDIACSFDGAVLLGTAGALKKAIPFLDAEFLVMYGDSYLPCKYAKIADAFRSSGRQGLMTVYRNDDRWDTSNVECRDGQILNYDKINRNSRMHHIDYGLGAFRSSLFAQLPQSEPCDLAGIYQDLLRRGELAAHEVDERFYEIGSPEGLRDLRASLAHRETSVT